MQQQQIIVPFEKGTFVKGATISIAKVNLPELHDGLNFLDSSSLFNLLDAPCTKWPFLSDSIAGNTLFFAKLERRIVLQYKDTHLHYNRNVRSVPLFYAMHTGKTVHV